jgi:polar amino acid transport system permease protein
VTAVDPAGSITAAPIEAVPLRHPWRWVAAAVIVGLVGLFIYGAATNKAYGWSTYTRYLFNERILLGVRNTLQLTVYAMILGVALGVVLSVMRLSPNPVFRSVAWAFLWIFRGTPVYVQLVFWGLLPTIYQNVALGVPFGPSLLHVNLQNLSIPFLLAVIGLGLNEAAYMTMRRTVLPQAMRVIIPPTGNELISMLKTTSLVTAVPYSYDLYSIASREIAARIFEPVPLLLVAATWYLVVTSILMVGQHYLEKYFSKGISRQLTSKQLAALAKAQADAGHL